MTFCWSLDIYIYIYDHIYTLYRCGILVGVIDGMVEYVVLFFVC